MCLSDLENVLKLLSVNNKKKTLLKIAKNILSVEAKNTQDSLQFFIYTFPLISDNSQLPVK